MPYAPTFGSVSNRVNKFIAETDAREFTARDIATAIGSDKVNVVSAALSKLKSDKKITYRIIPHEHWGRPIHMYLNPRETAGQVPFVVPPRPRQERGEMANPGCTRIVEKWIEEQLAASEKIRFTTTMVAKGTGLPLNRISALLNAFQHRKRITCAERQGCRNVYTSDRKQYFSYVPRRKFYGWSADKIKVPATDQRQIVEYKPEIRSKKTAPGLVDHLLETAIRVDKAGATREICLGLIETLCTYLKAVTD